MQGYLVKPKPVRTVYVAGSDTATATRVIEFLRDLGLEPVSGQRNRAGTATGWRILADLYNHNLQALLKSDLCLALLDGSLTDIADVCVEMGLAYANGIPVLGLCTSPELRASRMVVGMCRGDEQLAYSVEGLRDLVSEHIELTDAALRVDGK